MRYETILFDFDGTLGDTRANILLTMRMTLRKLGLPEKDDETIAAMTEANEIASGKRKAKSYKKANAMIKDILNE